MHLMCCEIWLPWQVMEEVSVWSGRSYHLAGEVLHICYSGYSFLTAINLRMLCSSTGKRQGLKTPLQWKEETLFYIAVWRHAEVFLASAVACTSGVSEVPAGFRSTKVVLRRHFLSPAIMQLQVVLKPNGILARLSWYLWTHFEQSSMSVFFIPLCYGCHIVPSLFTIRKEGKHKKR